MKKQLLSIFAALTVGTVFAQTPSPSWTISQNASFTVVSAGHRFLDALDANVVWLSGYDGFNANAAYNWFSRTTNGGASFTSGNIYPDTLVYNLSNLEGIDANTAWVCAYEKATQGDGDIHQTTNGGVNWNVMTAPGMFTNTTQSFANFVSFLTPNDGIVNGDPIGPGNGEFEIWTTNNGGTAWTQVPGSAIPNPLPGEFAIVNLYAKEGTTNLWFGTNKGRMYRTTDAGQTWNVSNVSASVNATVTEIAFASATHGICYVVGGTPAAFQVYNTTNGGVTWNLIPAHPLLGRNDICAIPGTGYYASVDNANQLLSYSKNNGVTWINWNSVGIPYVCIDMVNSYTGWVGGFSDPNVPSIGGIFKYNGIDFLSMFSIPSYACMGTSNATVLPVNTSTGAATPLTYTWSANPGGVTFSNPNGVTPLITFPSNGTYTVSLTVNNPDGTTVSTQTINVLTCAAPVANFNLTSNGCNNVAVTLTNTSTGAPTPSISVTSNPATNVTVTPGSGQTTSLKFATPGTYTVSLTATNGAGSDTFTQSITIADCAPTVSFSFPSVICNKKDTITTGNVSTGIITHTWSIAPIVPNIVFSAVGSGTLTDRKIAIPVDGTYTITLKASNASGTTTYTHAVLVESNCVSVAENSGLSNVGLYPNPTRDRINFTLPASSEGYKIKVTNVLGSVVYLSQKAVSNSKEEVSVSLAGNPKGIYFLTVESKNEKTTRKIVLE